MISRLALLLVLLLLVLLLLVASPGVSGPGELYRSVAQLEQRQSSPKRRRALRRRRAGFASGKYWIRISSPARTGRVVWTRMVLGMEEGGWWWLNCHAALADAEQPWLRSAKPQWTTKVRGLGRGGEVWPLRSGSHGHALMRSFRRATWMVQVSKRWSLKMLTPRASRMSNGTTMLPDQLKGNLRSGRCSPPDSMIIGSISLGTTNLRCSFCCSFIVISNTSRRRMLNIVLWSSQGDCVASYSQRQSTPHAWWWNKDLAISTHCASGLSSEYSVSGDSSRDRGSGGLGGPWGGDGGGGGGGGGGLCGSG